MLKLIKDQKEQLAKDMQEQLENAKVSYCIAIGRSGYSCSSSSNIITAV